MVHFSQTVFVGGPDEVLEYFSVFQNEEGDQIIVPDSLRLNFINSVWFNSYNIEVGVDEETI